MIRIGKISQVSENYDENWLIVRSLKTAVPGCAIHVPQLSPSKSLFYRYLDAKKAGQFNMDWFQSEYVPTFIKEMISDRANLELLDKLYRESFTKDIMLACFCAEEELCHRSIVAGMLKGVGAKIDCSADYLKYFDMFQRLCRERTA